MNKVIVDTNALISFVTDRNRDQQEKIAGLFDRAARMKTAVLCHQNVLAEFVYVMDTVYHVPKHQIRVILKDFISMPGIEMIHEASMEDLLAWWPDFFPDYGDGIIAVLCKAVKGSSVATFDKKFRSALKKQGLPLYIF